MTCYFPRALLCSPHIQTQIWLLEKAHAKRRLRAYRCDLQFLRFKPLFQGTHRSQLLRLEMA